MLRTSFLVALLAAAALASAVAPAAAAQTGEQADEPNGTERLDQLREVLNQTEDELPDDLNDSERLARLLDRAEDLPDAPNGSERLADLLNRSEAPDADESDRTADSSDDGAARTETNATRSSGQPEVRGFEAQIDPHLVLANWTYRAGAQEFRLTFRAEVATTVTIVEVRGQDDSGTQDINVQTPALPGGETTTVTMPARTGPSGEAKVTISTSRSVARGSAKSISTGQVEQNPFAAFGGTQGLFVGVGLTTAFALLAAAVTLRRESSGVEVAT